MLEGRGSSILSRDLRRDRRAAAHRQREAGGRLSRRLDGAAARPHVDLRRRRVHADSAQKFGAPAIAALDEFAPTASIFAKALGLRRDAPGRDRPRPRPRQSCSASRWRTSGSISKTATARGPTPRKTATPNRRRSEVAAGMAAGTLPPFIGIRIKPMSQRAARAQPAHARSVRHDAA